MSEGLRADYHITEGEYLADRRIDADERAYMNEQLNQIETAQHELRKYKNIIMIERRDANYDLLKDHVVNMKNAIQNSGDDEVIQSLDQYEQRFGTTNWKKE